MSNVIKVLRPDRVITLTDRTVHVRELSWINLKQLLEQITAKLAVAATVFGDEKLQLDLPTFTRVVMDSEELVEAVVLKTTDVNAEQLQELCVSEVLYIVGESLDLNINSLATGAKNAFGRIGNYVGRKAAATAKTPTTSLPLPVTS